LCDVSNVIATARKFSNVRFDGGDLWALEASRIIFGTKMYYK